MKYVEAIINFNNDPDVQQLREFYNTKTFPEILGVSRRELSHSSFLAWLFLSSERHLLGVQPVMQMLELYARSALEQQKVKDKKIEKIIYSILTRQIEILNTTVTTEETVTADGKKGRADIVVLCHIHLKTDNDLNRLRLVIENKVYSDEYDGQTETYFKYYSRHLREDERTIYMYLSPSRRTTSPECLQFVCITYQDLLDSILTPLIRQSNISQRTRFIMEEYTNSLSATSEDTQLALTQEEKELLNSFWESHNKLIMASITAFADMSEDPGVKEACRVIATVNGKRDRDRSKYRYNGEIYSQKTALVRTVVSDYVKSREGEGLTLVQIKAYFKFQPSMDNVFMDYDEYLRRLGERKDGGPVGFFGNKEDIFRIPLEDGSSFVISTNWPLRVKDKDGEFKKLLNRLEEQNIIVEQI